MGRRLLGAVLGFGALVAVLWVPLWWWAPPGWRPGWLLLAVTPLAVPGAALVGVVALATRHRVSGGAAVLAAVVLAALVVPRAIGADATPAGPGVVATTANLQFGRADAAELVRLVQARHVDVLGLQELTPDAEARLAVAGLFAALPYRVLAARPGAGGVGLASRYPAAPSPAVLRPAVFAQVSARVSAPGGPLDVVVTHPAAPIFRDDPDGWAREIRGLPDPAAPGAPARLVMGDLNATLDHRPVRDLLARGHRDAAAELGDGLVATWPTDRPFPAFAAIDHLLVSGPVAAGSLATDRIGGSDHAAVTATLVFPSR